MRRTLLGAMLLAAVAMTAACDGDGGTARAPEGGGGGAAPTVTTPAAGRTTPPTTTPPASYDPARDTTDLAISATGLVLEWPVGGVRHGTLVVTVQNKGPNSLWGLRVGVVLPASFTADGGDWAGCSPLKPAYAGYPASSSCDKGYLAPDRSMTLRLAVKSPAAKDGADGGSDSRVVSVESGGPKDSSYLDRDLTDNSTHFSITRR